MDYDRALRVARQVSPATRIGDIPLDVLGTAIDFPTRLVETTADTLQMLTTRAATAFDLTASDSMGSMLTGIMDRSQNASPDQAAQVREWSEAMQQVVEKSNEAIALTGGIHQWFAQAWQVEDSSLVAGRTPDHTGDTNIPPAFVMDDECPASRNHYWDLGDRIGTQQVAQAGAGWAPLGPLRTIAKDATVPPTLVTVIRQAATQWKELAAAGDRGFEGL